MKVLGLSKKEFRNNTYICEISGNEIANIFNKYSIEKTEIGDIDVGDEINLGAGYDFKNEIIRTLESVLDVNESFQKNYNSIIKLAEMATNKVSP